MAYKSDSSIQQVNEAIAEYSQVISSNNNLNLLPSSIQNGFFQNKLLVIGLIQNGLPYTLFEKIKSIIPYTEEEWANYLNLSVKTLQRNKKEANFLFKPIHSEKIIELAEVAYFGHEIFDSASKFYSWLSSNNYALGNHTPSNLLQNSYGKEMVMAELNRVDHGIFV